MWSRLNCYRVGLTGNGRHWLSGIRTHETLGGFTIKDGGKVWNLNSKYMHQDGSRIRSFNTNASESATPKVHQKEDNTISHRQRFHNNGGNQNSNNARNKRPRDANASEPNNGQRPLNGQQNVKNHEKSKESGFNDNNFRADRNFPRQEGHQRSWSQGINSTQDGTPKKMGTGENRGPHNERRGDGHQVRRDNQDGRRFDGNQARRDNQDGRRFDGNQARRDNQDGRRIDGNQVRRDNQDGRRFDGNRDNSQRQLKNQTDRRKDNNNAATNFKSSGQRRMDAAASLVMDSENADDVDDADDVTGFEGDLDIVKEKTKRVTKKFDKHSKIFQDNNQREDDYRNTMKKPQQKNGQKKKKENRRIDPVDIPRINTLVKLPQALTVRELAIRSGVQSLHLIQKLLDIGGLSNDGSDSQSGVEITQKISRHLLTQVKMEAKTGRRRFARHEVSTLAENLVLNREIAELLTMEFGLECEHEKEKILDEFRTDPESIKDKSKFINRDPIVTIMGHVDHGKTTLMDRLRHTAVAAGEAGGITQSVGAFRVCVDGTDQNIVFLDTPGHEAFTSMRKCGSMLTDVVVLVVAATDGVRPQTIESIELAQAAGVPLIVALSKIDVPGLNLEAAKAKVASQLSSHDVVTELYGGSVQMIPISAVKNIGIQELAEAILLQSQELALGADPTARGEAVVLESRLLPTAGAQADVVTRWGTLRDGDHIVCGEEYGRVRQMCDTVSGNILSEAGPSMPLRLLGLGVAPPPGSDVLVVESSKRAKQVAELRKRRREESERLTYESMDAAANIKAEDSNTHKTIPIILKADSDGTLEALRYSVDAVQHEFEGKYDILDEERREGDVDAPPVVRTDFKVVRRGVGPVIESDVEFAQSFNAYIFGFNVRVPQKISTMAREKKVSIVTESVIYHLLDDLKKTVYTLSPTTSKIEVRGVAEVLQLFQMHPTSKHPTAWVVAGCIVTEGKISKTHRLRVRRGTEILHKCGLDSLRRFKDDVDTVLNGQECGISLSSFQDFQVGDCIEAFEEVKDDVDSK